VSSHGTACWNFAGSVNNNAESVKSVTHRAVRFFNGSNCTGWEYTIWPNSLGFTANLPASSINQISSFRFGPDPNEDRDIVLTGSSRDYPTGCETSWSSWRTTGSPTWGQWRYCTAANGTHDLYRFQVDDTLTDGYAVHIEINECCGWQHVAWTGGGCLQSFGNGETSVWPAWGLAPGAQASVRLVKGTCDPHGNGGTSGSWIIANP